MIVPTNWNDREQKAEMRTLALPERAANTTLWLPGGTCLCIKEALGAKLLSPRGRHYFVERDKEVAKSIRCFVNHRSWKRKPSLHVGDISSLEVKPLDYAFFDFLGGLEAPVAQWLHQLDLNTGANLAFTFAYGWRGNQFMRTCQSVFHRTEYFYQLSVETRISNPVILLYLAVLNSVFDGYDFDTLRPIKYKDSTISMILYRFQNFRKRRNRRFGYFQSLVEGDETMTRAAALKAWATRRKDAKKRSAAAKKAWKTRRQNAAK